MLCECAQCLCLDLLTGVRIFVAVCLVISSMDCVVASDYLKRIIKGDEHNEELNEQVEALGRVPVMALCVEKLLILLFLIYALCVVFGAATDSRKRAVRRVRDLWLVQLVTDVLVAVPSVIRLMRMTKHGWPLYFWGHIAGFMVEFCAFLYVSSLDSVFQAGGTGKERKSGAELRREMLKEWQTDGTPLLV
eukprot:TRINITY_DN15794_c0_g1_i1.p1 TRINITY_DN15794_c0_g1~~TRINITY_DN15794_c0_g1_i1.p1  ORF type:complete len:212 (+),score=29.55 TRINITY_DN15794_c0_g1_i1:65-637(+)